MATKYVCDTCGKETSFEGEITKKMIKYDTDGRSVGVDMCTKCRREYDKLMVKTSLEFMEEKERCKKQNESKDI